MKVTKVSFVKKVNPKYPSLLGFAYLHIDNGLGIDSVGVHKNEQGEYHLAFPRMNERSIVYPLDMKSRKFLTDAVQMELEKMEGENVPGKPADQA